MNIINADKGEVMLGSGYVYAIKASDFTDNMAVSGMVELGYIREGQSVVFTRTHDSKEINSANYGLIALIGNNYQTTFNTKIISYNANNVAQFLTGSKVVTDATEGTKTTYFAEEDKIPEVALAFVGKDVETGDKFTLYMPKAVWTGEYSLDFNNDNPVELDYAFRCLNTTLPNGKIGAAYLVEGAEEEEETTLNPSEEETPAQQGNG